jgi:hypothetical protein
VFPEVETAAKPDWRLCVVGNNRLHEWDNVSNSAPNDYLGERVSDIDHIEEAILNPNFAKGGFYADWRRYRIEYGGHAQNCVMEGTIYLPPHADATAIVQLILGMEAWEGGA